MNMLGVIEKGVKGHIADGLQASADFLRTSAHVYEILNKLHSDTYRAGKLAWDNKGMINNIPAITKNTIAHLSGVREIDQSINPDTPNIMMLPGILSGVRSYSFLLHDLKKRQVDNIPSPHLPSYFKALFNIESAYQTAQNGLNVIYNSDIEGLVHLVAHSRGCIVATIMKILDEQNEGPNRIGEVINMAGPHQGTDHVTIFYLNEIFAILGDMSPDASPVKQIKEYAPFITNIVAANDNLVLPNRQILTGVKKQIIVEMDHLDIPGGNKKDIGTLGEIIAEELYAA